MSWTVKADYQGHTNYETWAMKLWIDNEEGSYEEMREVCKNAVNREDSVEDAIHAAASLMEDSWEGQIPDVGSTVFADFLNTSFKEIDWHDVVEADVKDFWEDKEKDEKEE